MANLARLVAVVGVLVLLTVLLWMLPQPGYSRSRLVLFALIAGAAVLGATGVLLRRSIVTTVAVVGLFLLGVWQAVLSVFIWPVIGLFLLVALLDYEDSSDREAV
jgi:hypothetical protein